MAIVTKCKPEATPSTDPALAAARAFHAADDVSADGDPTVIDMDAAYVATEAANLAFAASIPTTAAGAIAKLRACMRLLNCTIDDSRNEDEITITEIGLVYLAAQIETTIRGLARPRLVWAARSPAE